jgi:outer membrane lipoprotein-sorting protein
MRNAVTGDRCDRYNRLGQNMRFTTGLIGAACAAFSLMAQAPDAKALLAESGKTLFASGPFRMESQTIMDMQGAGMNNKMTMTIKMASATGKFRMDMSPMGVSVVSDGQSLYFWLAPLNQYMKKPAPASADGLGESLLPGVSGLLGQMKDSMSANIVRQDVIDFAGKKTECYVIETKLDKTTLPGPSAATISNMRQTSWIDKDRKFLMKQVADMEMQMGATASPMTMHSEMTVTSLDLSPIFSPDEFKFTPPEGAKLVESLPGMDNLKLGK